MAVGCIGSPRGAEEYDPVVERLGSPDWETREAATEALARIGEETLPALERARSHDDPEVRWRALGIARSIRAQGEARERARLFSISAEEEARTRRESRLNLVLWQSERGHFSGYSQAIPFFRTDYDTRREHSESVIWPLGSGWWTSEDGFGLYSIPLLFNFRTSKRRGDVQLNSVPLIYRHSESEKISALVFPPLLSGYVDTPQVRVVSVFPILFHWVDKRRDREALTVLPFLTSFKRRGERFSISVLFSLLLEYTYDPRWQEIRIFRFIHFRWGEPAPELYP